MRAPIPILATMAAVVAALPSTAFAQGSTGADRRPASPSASAAVPPFIRRGLEQLRTDSVDAAIATWTATWTSPSDSATAQTLVGSMRQLRQLAGASQGYEIVGVEPVGAHLRRIYVLFRFPSQPIFAHFVVYAPKDAVTEQDWRLVTVTWNTNPAEAWPPTVWVR